MTHKYDFEECTCECHTNPRIKHIVACCFTCNKCEKRVKRLYYDNHEKHNISANSNSKIV